MSTSIVRHVPGLVGTESEGKDTRCKSEPKQEYPEREPAVEVISSTVAHLNYPSRASDAALIALVRHGDNEALTLLFRRYARLVRSVAWKILRDRFEADDLLQEIFILVHAKASTFDSSKASARFWILQMTYHRAISRLRYLKCRHFYERLDLDDVEPQLPDPSNQIDRVDQYLDSAVKNSALQKLMARLSDNQQKTLRLYFFEGYTLDEIAVELGQTRENVRNHYFRGLAKLRTQIFSTEIEDELGEQIFCKDNARRPI